MEDEKKVRRRARRKDRILSPSSKNNESISPRSLDYIDTLYLSTNLNWHIPEDRWRDHGNVNAEYLYNWKLREFSDRLESATSLGSSGGYEWYGMENYRIGIASYAKAKLANQPNCVIQYEHGHLWLKGRDLKGLDLPFSDDRSLYMIKRIDVTKTICLDTDYTVDYGFISGYHTDPFNPTRFKNTVYLGSRKNGNCMRIYSKSTELGECGDGNKQQRYWEYFGGLNTLNSLYTFEVELLRKYLRPVLGINTLSHLDRVWKASAEIMGKVRMFKLTDRNRKLYREGNKDKIWAIRLAPPSDSYDRPELPQYDPSYPHHVERVLKEIEHFMERVHMRGAKDYDPSTYILRLLTDIVNRFVSEEDMRTLHSDLAEWLEDFVIDLEENKNTKKGVEND